VTRLRDFDVGSDSRFVLDLGLFHDELTDEQRGAIGRKVSTVAAPGATLPTAAWAPGRRGPLPRGAGPGGTGRAWKSRKPGTPEDRGPLLLLAKQARADRPRDLRNPSRWPGSQAA